MNSKRKLHDAAPPTWPLELQSEWHDGIEELHQESDRAVALLGAAYLDTALKSLFKASLAGGKVVANKLFEKNAPLASFRRASQWLTALVTLVQTISNALEAVREIRNVFAHFRRNLTFEDDEIRHRVEAKFKLPLILPDPAPDLALTRNRYIWTTAMILSRLTWTQLHVKPPAPPAGT